jgi:hypothetical protein
LFNYYDCLVVLDDPGFNFHLLVGLQRAGALRFLSHTLDRIHNVALLREESVAQIGGPLNVIS